MDDRISERRRLLRLFMLGSLGVPALVLAGCGTGSGRRTRPPRFGGGGGGNDKSGNNGGPGAAGSR